MKITPQITFIQEKCILSAHPGMSLEEAKVVEGKMIGSLHFLNHYNKSEDSHEWYTVIREQNGVRCYMPDLPSRRYRFFDECKLEDIIGLPPTLARVLKAFDYNHGYDETHEYMRGGLYKWEEDEICKWKLLNDDGSDATLFDQSDETIDAIAKELGYEIVK